MTETVAETAPISGRNFVGGAWTPSARGLTYTKRNPARPSEVTGEFPESGEEDVEQAARAAWGGCSLNALVRRARARMRASGS